MNNIVIIIVFLGVVLALLMGWFIARWKFKRKIKRLDKQINTPDTVEYIKHQLDEQEKVTNEREVKENDRRRAIFRGYGDRKLIPIELGRGESEVERGIGGVNNPSADERPSQLSDTDVNKAGEIEQSIGAANRDSEEDWPDFG